MESKIVLPQIIDASVAVKDNFPYLSEREVEYIDDAKKLFGSGMYSYAMIAIWDAAVYNLKRKVEAYGIELWESVIKSEPGRKKYNKDGDSISDRWGEVDDFILIQGVAKLGLLDQKAAKSLEMINWMRNHASSAHDSECKVNNTDVIALVLLLQSNLFEKSLPDPRHSVSAIFNPIKTKSLGEDEINLLKDEIASYKQQDIRTVFGFLLDLVEKGKEPALTNAKKIFPDVWNRATEDLKKTLGFKFHSYFIDPSCDESDDKRAKTRILELILQHDAVKYIPDSTRSRLFRRAAELLGEAKDTAYGWAKEVRASNNLIQFGTSVPSIAFEAVYQEILAVWCGNFWGRSDAHDVLQPFIDCLTTDQMLVVINMFRSNKRVKDELYQNRPKRHALELLTTFEKKLTIGEHKNKLKETYEYVELL